MPESVYKVIELVGTQRGILGEGRQRRGGQGKCVVA